MGRYKRLFSKVRSALIVFAIFCGLYLINNSKNDKGHLILVHQKNCQNLTTLAISKSLRTKKDRTLADKLVKEIRILCWVAVTNKSMNLVAMINDTWGRRCTKILFIGDRSTKLKRGIISLNIPSGRDNLWLKSRKAFEHIAKNHLHEADWILKADTDTYVIIENLRYFLHLQDPQKPHYLGCHIKLFTQKGYNSGGAGYVFNKLALKKLLKEGFQNETCVKGHQQDAEDVSMGYCMGLIDIPPEDTTDEHGKNRFFPFEPFAHVFPAKIGNENIWYYGYSHKPGNKSLDCCSETVITFHYVSVKVFWTMEYLLYHTQLFGVAHSLQ